MKGFKLRTPDQPLSMAIAKAMGANPTPMALSEVYLALQQGVVDGQENPIPNIYANKFHEVQSYVNLTAHVIQLTPIWINKKKWDALPEAYKKAVQESVDSLVPQINQWIKDDEIAQLELMKKGGVQVVQSDLDAFREATKGVYKDFENRWGAGLYEKIQSVK